MPLFGPVPLLVLHFWQTAVALKGDVLLLAGGLHQACKWGACFQYHAQGSSSLQQRLRSAAIANVEAASL